jgi:ATP-binding cassette subfamily G (WHITE) protein 2 (SNQ2)
MVEIPILFSHRTIISRHHQAALYHPFIEAAALILVDTPITLITTFVYGISMYEIVQFQQSAGQLL